MQTFQTYCNANPRQTKRNKDCVYFEKLPKFEERFDAEDIGETTLYFTAPKEILKDLAGYQNLEDPELLYAEVALHFPIGRIEAREAGPSITPMMGDEDYQEATDWTDIDLPYEDIERLMDIAGV